MTRQLKIFWLGMLIYVASFFLVAVELSSPIVGFGCALIAFVYPWVEAKEVLLHGLHPQFGPFAWACLLVSGWVNPIFVLMAFLDLAHVHIRLVNGLRMLVVLMIPSCWLFLLSTHFRVREGHFAWVIGMLLALFSDRLAGSEKASGTG
jgi:hypothetical protein